MRRTRSPCPSADGQLHAAANGVSLEVLESDGFAALTGRRFDWVVTNPPIRAGKQVIYGMFAQAAEALLEGTEE